MVACVMSSVLPNRLLVKDQEWIKHATNAALLQPVSRTDIDTINGALIMMASNQSADRLNAAYLFLAHLSDIKTAYRSSIYQSTDYTKQSNVLYYNQAVFCLFNSAIVFNVLDKQLKEFEQQNGRNLMDKKCVPIDLDILWVQKDNQFLAIIERLPLKEHEWVCLDYKIKL